MNSYALQALEYVFRSGTSTWARRGRLLATWRERRNHARASVRARRRCCLVAILSRAGVELGAAALAAVSAVGTASVAGVIVCWWLGGVCFIAAGARALHSLTHVPRAERVIECV